MKTKKCWFDSVDQKEIPAPKFEDIFKEFLDDFDPAIEELCEMLEDFHCEDNETSNDTLEFGCGS